LVPFPDFKLNLEISKNCRRFKFKFKFEIVNFKNPSYLSSDLQV
jgi:hypothetical protein